LHHFLARALKFKRSRALILLALFLSLFSSGSAFAQAPAAPTNVTATPASSTQINLTWTAPSGTVNSYLILRNSNAYGSPDRPAVVVVALTATQTSYEDTGLVPGDVYGYMVYAINSVGSSGYTMASAQTYCAAPSGLAAVSFGGSITLYWPGDTNAYAYTILRGTSPGQETPYDTTYAGRGPVDAGGDRTNTYTDPSASTGVTYYYTVEATDGAGNSAPSNEANAEVGSLLSPPTNLEANVASDSEIDLTWTAPASGSVTSYLIERDEYLDWQWVAADYETTTDTSFSDIGLEAGPTYVYTVSAVDGASQSNPSNEADADIPCLPPASLTAASVGGQITLDWPNDPNAASYWIFRGTTPGGESLLDSSGWSIVYGRSLGANIGDMDEYVDASADPGVTYYYEVEAIDGEGNPSAPSPEAQAEVSAVPSAPTGLAATAVSDSQINLTWTASTSSVSGYEIYCVLNYGSPQPIGTTASTTFSATGLNAGSNYTFYVAAISDAGIGNNSSPASCYTLCAPPVLTAVSSTGAITLTWLHDWNSTAYWVYRGTVSGGETLFDSDQNDILYYVSSVQNGILYGGNTYDEYVDTTATPGVTYYYEIVAVNADGGPSAPSNEVSVVGPAGGGAPPTNLVATAVSSSQINLTWSAPAGTVTSYQIYVSTQDGWGAFTPLQYLATTTATSYSNTGLYSDCGYKYAVVAVYGDASQASSQTVLQYTLCDPPQGITAVAAAGQITVSWLAGYASSYEILRGVVSGGEVLYDANPLDINYYAWYDDLWNYYDDFVDTSATPGVTYYYQVIAINPIGALSAPSSEVSATVPVGGGPTIATAASASPNPVTGTTTALSVLGADALGESSLTYAWSTTGTPPAAVTYSDNGTNSAKNTTVTFTQAGTYNFLVTIIDTNDLSVTSSVTVTVDQTFSAITVSPGTAIIAPTQTHAFTASAMDQFGNALSTQPTFTWSVASGGAGGSIDQTGLYTAPICQQAFKSDPLSGVMLTHPWCACISFC